MPPVSLPPSLAVAPAVPSVAFGAWFPDPRTEPAAQNPHRCRLVAMLQVDSEDLVPCCFVPSGPFPAQALENCSGPLPAKLYPPTPTSILPTLVVRYHWAIVLLDI